MSSNLFIIEDQRLNFKPTYLMIKQHEITGLKYLCKTTRKNPIKYQGSGKYWMKHIKKHGKEHVKTIWYKLFSDIDKLTGTALALSEMYDVTNSPLWANLKPENGLDGWVTGQKHREKSKTKISVSLKSLVDSGTHNWVGENNPVHKKVSDGTHNLLGGAITKLNNSKRLEDGTHNFLGDKNPSHNRIKNGTHNFLDEEFKNMMREINRRKQTEKVEAGTHHLLGGNLQRRLVANGTHNLVGSVTCRTINGTVVQIPKEQYHSQNGCKNNWDFVYINSDEGKRRKL